MTSHCICCGRARSKKVEDKMNFPDYYLLIAGGMIGAIAGGVSTYYSMKKIIQIRTYLEITRDLFEQINTTSDSTIKSADDLKSEMRNKILTKKSETIKSSLDDILN